MKQTDFDKITTNAAAGILAGQELADQAATMAAVIHHADLLKEGRPYLVKPDGTLVNMEGYLPAPVMRRGDVQVHAAVSFAGYINRFKSNDSVIFADQVAQAFTGVLDYHREGATGTAGWARHRVTLKLQPTEAWLEWTGQDKKAMTQADFATWIEERIPDIASPDGADIVTMARNLEARKDVAFKSHIRTDNGSHIFAYSEMVQGSARDGSLTIPADFTLALIPFLGADTYQVTARFRYRLNGSQLALSYELVRIKDVLEKAFADEREDIVSTVEDVTMFNGPAPAAQKAD
jgi:uncharacterized protein YfdQ (DUF2303 family)